MGFRNDDSKRGVAASDLWRERLDRKHRALVKAINKFAKSNRKTVPQPVILAVVYLLGLVTGLAV